MVVVVMREVNGLSIVAQGTSIMVRSNVWCGGSDEEACEETLCTESGGS